MIKYKSDGTWFDEGSIVRLIDDYRPTMNSGLFIGFVDGVIDQEICGFDEFEEVDVSEMDTELDDAWKFQDDYWKGVDIKKIRSAILLNYK